MVKQERVLHAPMVVEESPQSCFHAISNTMNRIKPKVSEVTLKEIPAETLAEIRHLVQLLAHENPAYRTTSLAILGGLMMKYPVITPSVANNVIYIYSKRSGSVGLRPESKQAKLLGCGCIIRSGTAFGNSPLLMRLVSEILITRISADKDDLDSFFLLSALQHNDAVQDISELILTSMEKELSVPVNEMKLSTLWLRVGLAQRMMETGVKMPVFLRDTFTPDNVIAMGSILLPGNQKVEPIHPALETFIDSLASYHKHWITFKSNSKKNKEPRPNPVSVMFTVVISRYINENYKFQNKLQNLSVAYKLLESVVQCPHMDLNIYDSLINWLAGSGGMDILHKEVKQMVLDGLLKQTKNLFEKYDTDEMRSVVCLSVMRGAQSIPQLLSVVSKNLHFMSPDDAKDAADNLIKLEWKKLSDFQVSVLLRLIASKQLSGVENKQWRVNITEKLLKRALMRRRTNIDDEEKDLEEEEASEEENNAEQNKKNLEKKKKVYSRKIDPNLIDDQDVFFRFLSTISQDKNAFGDIYLTAHNQMVKLVTADCSLLKLPADVKKMWLQIDPKIKHLNKYSEKQFKYKNLFLMLLCQLSLEFMRVSSDNKYSHDLLSDLLTCMEKAIENPTGGALVINGKQQQQRQEEDDESSSDDENEPPSDWKIVLIDILMAIAAKNESWWRIVLKPAGRVLGADITAECLEPVMDVLLRDDTVRAEGYDSDEDEEENNDEESDIDDEEEEEEEDDEEEKENNEESDEAENSEDESDEDSDDDDEEDNAGNNKDLEMLKSDLMNAMGPLAVKNDGDDSDDSECEDMDAVPKETLNQIDEKLGQVFKMFMDQKKAMRKNNKRIGGIDSELMAYRNRVLDFIEGVVEGNPPAPLLLSSITLPLVQVLKFNDPKKFVDMAQKIKSIFNTIRSQKPRDVETFSEQELIDAISEIFTYVKYIPQCYYGAIVILKYSALLCGNEKCNPILDSFLENVVIMLRSNSINKHIIVETVAVDVPDLRYKLLQTVIHESFLREDVSSMAKRYHHEMWELLHKLLVRIQSCPKLDKENALIEIIGEQVQIYLKTCTTPARKTLTPLSQILKVIKKNDDYAKVVNWKNMRGCVDLFQKNNSSKSGINKNIKKDIDRILSITLSSSPSDTKANLEKKQMKQDLKRKRKEKRLEKQEKRRKIEPSVENGTEKSESNDNNKKGGSTLFGSDFKNMDDDDEDFDEEQQKQDLIDSREKKVQKMLENQQAIKEKKAKVNRSKKERAKASRDRKREAMKAAKVERAKLAAESAADGVSKKPLIIKDSVKKNRYEADKILSSELKTGLFSSVVGETTTEMEE